MERESKVESIQLGRGLAASIVAVSHIAFGYADHIGPGLGVANCVALPAQAAVCLFFIISGYVMVISSHRLYGKDNALRVFLIRRAVRILPSWWIASVSLACVFLWLDLSFDAREFVLSLVLIPYDTAGFAGRPSFLLWPGWTLFYEMVFYLLFGLALGFGRTAAIATASAAILALVLCGAILNPAAAWVVSLTRPVFLLFLVGMFLAIFRENGRALPWVARWTLVAAGAAASIFVTEPEGAAGLGFDYLVWAGLPAACFAAALLGGSLKVPCFLIMDRFGDTSFALYILHVPLAHIWINIFPLQFGAWPFLLSAIVFVLGVSYAFFMLLERSLTRKLNLVLGARTPNDRQLERTSV
ncbi:acyltransferase family protein [Erythrobacter sp.]|uniref:acyltransferase family protein n=1 Tax=Erythrobacter sp. TaxID=1042 RepID=UPI003C7305BC